MGRAGDIVSGIIRSEFSLNYETVIEQSDDYQKYHDEFIARKAQYIKPVSYTHLKVTDARTLTISPWDMTTVKSIEKAILASDLGITPQNDGKVIRLAFPQPTEERRREMTKQISKMGEDVKVAVRNVSREAIDAAKAAKKAGEMTEDEQKQSEKLVQDLTDKYAKEIDKVTEAKLSLIHI